MKQSIGFCQFCDAFRDMDRNENFSYQGKRVLFDYLEEMEETMPEEIELDIVALCCDYSEDTVMDIADNYSIDIKGQDDDEAMDTVRDYLEENTILVGETDTSFVYACF